MRQRQRIVITVTLELDDDGDVAAPKMGELLRGYAAALAVGETGGTVKGVFRMDGIGHLSWAALPRQKVRRGK